MDQKLNLDQELYQTVSSLAAMNRFDIKAKMDQKLSLDQELYQTVSSIAAMNRFALWTIPWTKLYSSPDISEVGFETLPIYTVNSGISACNQSLAISQIKYEALARALDLRSLGMGGQTMENYE